jgi:hypothetical protein
LAGRVILRILEPATLRSDKPAFDDFPADLIAQHLLGGRGRQSDLSISLLLLVHHAANRARQLRLIERLLNQIYMFIQTGKFLSASSA